MLGCEKCRGARDRAPQRGSMASAAFLGGEVCTGRGQLVAGAVNGQDKPRTEAAAEASDVDVDGALVTVIVARPDAVEQVRPREDLAGMACEDLEQTKLARLQIEVARPKRTVRCITSTTRSPTTIGCGGTAKGLTSGERLML